MSATQDDNAAQREYWNGKAGENWAREAERLDGMLAPFITAVLGAAGLEGGERVLDVGCGSGALSLAALRAGAGQVTGVDVSAPMLALGRQRADGETQVQFVEADASKWQADQSFDRLISRFGVMFFADPQAAFSNLHAQMTPGGRLAFACWQPLDQNEWALLPLRAALSLTDQRLDRPEPGAPGPFAFEDPDRTVSILERAGWKSAEAKPWVGQIALPGESVSEAAAFATKMGPTARLIAELEMDANRVRETVEARLAEKASADGRVRLDAAAWIVTADV
ncbi:methyltransferase domain-containing protein [Henriciella sp.]|uniref:class I SAM-dependent methyltransferase n=1 Tax=Henriciella sp. TaxID=1968823 RepID=UPI002627B42C|nr:methyltransferase domain-containing protein [Henriciella sp.]